MLLPKLGGSWLLPPRDFPHLNEFHPMDHDSVSSGHANNKDLTLIILLIILFGLELARLVVDTSYVELVAKQRDVERRNKMARLRR
jgi:hypothetical protein